VVAADDDQGDAGAGERDEGAVEQRDGLQGWHRAVVDVAADQDGVDRLGLREREQPVEEGLVRVVQAGLEQGAAEVPVGRVEQSHADPSFPSWPGRSGHSQR